jgi:hypothetical protein
MLNTCVLSLHIPQRGTGSSPLYSASFNGHVDVVRTLLFAGAAVNLATVSFGIH